MTHFPDDLVFQQTADRTNFRGRYVLQHPWQGSDACEAAHRYRDALPDRFEREAQTLASPTGWSVTDIRRKMPVTRMGTRQDAASWWDRLWKQARWRRWRSGEPLTQRVSPQCSRAVPSSWSEHNGRDLRAV